MFLLPMGVTKPSKRLPLRRCLLQIYGGLPADATFAVAAISGVQKGRALPQNR